MGPGTESLARASGLHGNPPSIQARSASKGMRGVCGLERGFLSLALRACMEICSPKPAAIQARSASKGMATRRGA